MASRSHIPSRWLVASILPMTLGLGIAILDNPESARGGVLSFTWMWPIDTPHVVVREFFVPTSDYGPGHRGIDIAVTNGDVVTAPAAGRVLFSGMVAGRGVLTIEHDDDVVSTLEPVTSLVTPGQVVTAGTAVAVVHQPDVVWDSSHVCSCLHLGARYRGEYVSPRTLLEQGRRVVLKPWGDGPAVMPGGALARRSP